MQTNNEKIGRPLALVILDGWGYAPRTEGNAIAIAHTPYYDAISRSFPMTTLVASGESVGRSMGSAGNAEAGHLTLGTGRVAQTEVARIQTAVESGAFLENEVLNSAFAKAKANGSLIHLIGMISESGIHATTENLFELLRLAKQHGVKDVFIHCFLDGLDVAERTADIYIEALEIKLADIGVGQIATLCGRYFAMDNSENWERTARAYTMLAHAEGERASDAVAAIRNSFLRGISDEFISPIVLEKEPNVPVTTVKNGDLVVYFNHRADAMLQLVRSVSVPDESAGAKPIVDTVCLTEYDPGFGLPAAFRSEAEKNTLTGVLSELEIPNFKITESSRFRHLTHFFDGRAESQTQFEQQILVPGLKDGLRYGHPESESFKITDKFLRGLESSGQSVFVVNIPAADMMAETGDMGKTIAAIQFIDTCLGGICEGMRERDGVVLITSTHGNCEEMFDPVSGERIATTTANPVPFHYIDAQADNLTLRENGALSDIAPTILGVLGIEKPAEMTARTFVAIRIVLRETELNFQTILVIDFGQLGDVVLSLPALRAVRERFADARITLLMGKASGEIARLADVSDDRILVDRVALRDGNKAKSVLEIFRLVREVRRRKFDFVIDLHSLYETNLLGFLTGAEYRLFANRENRSIDFLANFPGKPAREDKSLHHAERYFAVLKPLGIERQESNLRIQPLPDELDRITELYASLGVTKKHRVGLFLGAGHLGRRWGIAKFTSLADKLSANGDIDVLVFLGPEEADLRQEAAETMSPHAVVMPEMPLAIFFAALGMLDAFVSTDTGPMHLAAVAGASIILITEKGATKIFLPLTDELRIVDTAAFDRIGVDEVYDAVIDSLN